MAERKQGMEQLSRDGSKYNLSTSILPSPTHRRVKVRRFIIRPWDRRYRAWETFLIVLVVYTAWISPFEFGFLDNPWTPLAVTNNIVNGFFAIDIVLTFFVSYYDETTRNYLLIDDPKQIAWRYTTSGFLLDVISIIPLEVARKFLPRQLQTNGLFNMLRLWRLRRGSALVDRLGKNWNYNYFAIICAKLIGVTLFAVHCTACFYNFIAVDSHDASTTWIRAFLPNFIAVDSHDAMTWVCASLPNCHAKSESVWIRYGISIYWSITTLTYLLRKFLLSELFYVGLTSYMIAYIFLGVPLV